METNFLNRSGSRTGSVRTLVIHGMEYHSEEEVKSELIKPLRSTMESDRSSRTVEYVHWDSRLDSCSGLKMHPFGTFTRNLPKLKSRLLRPVSFWESLCERAETVGQSVADVIRKTPEILDRDTVIITHSIGGLVWSVACRSLIESQSAEFIKGRWLNLQPAISADQQANEFSHIDSIYGQRQTIVYSRYDFVLRYLMKWAVRSPAIGLTGPQGNAIGVDASKWAMEAHGQTFLIPKLGGFLSRGSSHIRNYFIGG